MTCAHSRLDDCAGNLFHVEPDEAILHTPPCVIALTADALTAALVAATDQRISFGPFSMIESITDCLLAKTFAIYPSTVFFATN